MVAVLHMLGQDIYASSSHHTNSYLLGEGLVCIDQQPPIAEEQEKLYDYIEHVTKLRGGQLSQIWLTHQHKDHIGAVDFQAGAEVVAHRETARALEENSSSTDASKTTTL